MASPVLTDNRSEDHDTQDDGGDDHAHRVHQRPLAGVVARVAAVEGLVAATAEPKGVVQSDQGVVGRQQEVRTGWTEYPRTRWTQNPQSPGFQRWCWNRSQRFQHRGGDVGLEKGADGGPEGEVQGEDGLVYGWGRGWDGGRGGGGREGGGGRGWGLRECRGRRTPQRRGWVVSVLVGVLQDGSRWVTLPAARRLQQAIQVLQKVR